MSRVTWMLTGRPTIAISRVSQRHQRGRDVGVVIAERLAVDAGHEEAVHRVERQQVRSHEREIEIAGPRAVGVKRRAVLPPHAGHGAAAQDGVRAGWKHFAYRLAEFLQALGRAAERQLQQRLPHLFVGERLG